MIRRPQNDNRRPFLTPFLLFGELFNGILSATLNWMMECRELSSKRHERRTSFSFFSSFSVFARRVVQTP